MITIDYKDRTPIYEQITKNIENLIALGVFKQDDKLPSVRSLAVELSINPNTIQKAYQMLEIKNLIYTVKGVGNFISQEDNLVKDKKLIELYEQVKSTLKLCTKYGLNEYTFNQWVENLRGEFYDNCN